MNEYKETENCVLKRLVNFLNELSESHDCNELSQITKHTHVLGYLCH